MAENRLKVGRMYFSLSFVLSRVFANIAFTNIFTNCKTGDYEMYIACENAKPSTESRLNRFIHHQASTSFLIIQVLTGINLADLRNDDFTCHRKSSERKG